MDNPKIQTTQVIQPYVSKDDGTEHLGRFLACIIFICFLVGVNPFITLLISLLITAGLMALSPETFWKSFKMFVWAGLKYGVIYGAGYGVSAYSEEFMHDHQDFFSRPITVGNVLLIPWGLAVMFLLLKLGQWLLGWPSPMELFGRKLRGRVPN